MNPHYDEAQRLSTESSLVNEWGLTERQIIATRAQAKAILALAYEQRTASMISILGGPDIPLFTKDKNIDERYLPMMTELRERLGLA